MTTSRSHSRIGINHANAHEIERACGIDGVLANRIVQYRTQHGPFKTRDDLDQVPGFADIRVDEVLAAVDLPSSPTRRSRSRTEAAQSANSHKLGRANSTSSAWSSDTRVRAGARSRGASKPDINEASHEELVQACGIDGELAQRIIDARPFRTLKDLDRVPQIGQMRMQILREAVRLPDR